MRDLSKFIHGELMKSIFEIKASEIGRQMTDAEMIHAVSIDWTDILNWVVPTRGAPSNGSGGG
jgi:hypothetical protein